MRTQVHGTTEIRSYNGSFVVSYIGLYILKKDSSDGMLCISPPLRPFLPEVSPIFVRTRDDCYE